MQHAVPIGFVALFPVFFVGMWLFVSFMLSIMSNWRGLAQRYPDQPEPALQTFHMQSGSMGGGVKLNNALRLSVCRSGLRVGVLFLFAAFSRDFLVPWSEIGITQTGRGWFRRTRLDFGRPPIGMLTLSAKTAEQLAASAQGRWPAPAEPSASREPTVS